MRLTLVFILWTQISWVTATPPTVVEIDHQNFHSGGAASTLHAARSEEACQTNEDLVFRGFPSPVKTRVKIYKIFWTCGFEVSFVIVFVFVIFKTDSATLKAQRTSRVKIGVKSAFENFVHLVLRIIFNSGKYYKNREGKKVVLRTNVLGQPCGLAPI